MWGWKREVLTWAPLLPICVYSAFARRRCSRHWGNGTWPINSIDHYVSKWRIHYPLHRYDLVGVIGLLPILADKWAVLKVWKSEEGEDCLEHVVGQFAGLGRVWGGHGGVGDHLHHHPSAGEQAGGGWWERPSLQRQVLTQTSPRQTLSALWDRTHSQTHTECRNGGNARYHSNVRMKLKGGTDQSFDV